VSGIWLVAVYRWDIYHFWGGIFRSWW